MSITQGRKFVSVRTFSVLAYSLAKLPSLRDISKYTVKSLYAGCSLYLHGGHLSCLHENYGHEFANLLLSPQQ